MKITKDNIGELPIGQKIYIARSFNMQENMIYVGKFEHHYFMCDNHKTISIYINNPDSCYELKSGNMYTSYEECCEKMRELCIESIDHFNRHQLKNNPIIIEQ